MKEVVWKNEGVKGGKGTVGREQQYDERKKGDMQQYMISYV